MQKGEALKISKAPQAFTRDPSHMYSLFFVQLVHPETNQTDHTSKKLENTWHHAIVIADTNRDISTPTRLTFLLQAPCSAVQNLLHSDICETCHASSILE
jgi:hypothetical protein